MTGTLGWRRAQDEKMLTTVNTFMHTYQEWLTARTRIAIPDATKLTALIAQAGAAGVPHHDLHKALGLEPETLNGLLTALIDVGQITLVLVNGKRVYRAGV